MRKGQRFPTPRVMEELVPRYMGYRSQIVKTWRKDHEGIIRKFAQAWDYETRHESPNRLIDNLDKEWVQEYYLATYSQHAATTKRAYQNVIKQFCEWLVRYGVDPDCGNFKPGHTAGRSTRRFLWLNAEEMRDAWELEPEVYWSMLFMWLCLTCCRVNEAQAAQWGDIKGLVWWGIRRRKTNDPTDIIKLPKRLREALPRYRMWYAGELGREIEDTDYVFPSIGVRGRGKTLYIEDPKKPRGVTTHRKIRAMIVVAKPDADPELLERSGCHTCRRSGAQEMLNKLAAMGVQNALKLVSVRLGHDSVKTTEGYLNTNVFKQQLHEIMDDFDLYDEDKEAEVIQLSQVL
jgi:integrase